MGYSYSLAVFIFISVFSSAICNERKETFIEKDLIYNYQQQSVNGTSGEYHKPLEPGLGPFRTMVNGFLSIVQTNDLTYINNSIAIDFSSGAAIENMFKNHWNVFVIYMIGFVLCILAGVLFIIIMPIIGWCTCCCRCCGNCGGKKRRMDGKSTTCARHSCGILMFILTTVVLAGAILSAYVSVRMYDQLQNGGTIDVIQGSLRQVDSYKNNIPNDLENTVRKLETTKEEIFEYLYDMPAEVTDTIGNTTNATFLLNNLNGMGDHIYQLQSNLSALNTSSQHLINQGTALQKELNAIANKIDAITVKCNTSECKEIKEDTIKMKYIPKYDDINVTLPLIGVDIVIAANVTKAIATGTTEFLSIEKKINDTAHGAIRNAEDKTNEVIKKVNDAVNQLGNSVRNINISQASKAIDDVKPYIKTAGNIWLAATMTTTSIIVLIVILNYCGLTHGACCERPTEGDTCCTRATGANCLLASAAFVFIFSFFLMLMVIPMFGLGGVFHTELCRHLTVTNENTASLQIINTHASKAVTKLANTSIDILNITDNCKDNMALYTALNIEQMGDKYNISKIIDVSALKNELDKVKNINVDLSNIVILKNETFEVLNAFTKQLQMNNTAIDSVLAQNVTGIDLDTFSEKLLKYNQSLFQNIADNLTMIKNSSVHALEKERTQALSSWKNVKYHASYMPTTEIVDMLRKAQDTIQRNGSDLVKSVVNTSVSATWSKILATKTDIENDVRNEIGKCGPVYDALGRSINSTCINVLTPFNAFWFSYGWCLFFFIPCLIIAFKLAKYYRTPEEYSETSVNDDDFIRAHIERPRSRNDMLLHRVERKDVFPVDNPIYQQDVEYTMPRAKVSPGSAPGRSNRAVYPDLNGADVGNVWASPPPYQHIKQEKRRV